MPGILDILSSFGNAFLLGLATPLTAVCVLPLYPGFLAYLSNISSEKTFSKRSFLPFGLLAAAGIILFMSLLGLIFTTFLQVSLTRVVGIVSPISFVLLGIISTLLIFDINFGKFFPEVRPVMGKNPHRNAFIFGLFFGGVVLPCNPGFIAALFARSLLATNFFSNIMSFISFGIGMSFPLIFFSLLSSTSSKAVINFLTKYRRWINLLAGLIMLAISLYYLIFVFRLFG